MQNKVVAENPSRICSMQTTKDYYRILQVDPSAGCEVIKAAFRRMTEKYYPSINFSSQPSRIIMDLQEDMIVRVFSKPFSLKYTVILLHHFCEVLKGAKCFGNLLRICCLVQRLDIKVW